MTDADQLLVDIQDAQIEEYIAARERLPIFVKGAWDTLEPETDLKWNWHHEYICEHLEACDDGQITRLIINVCPRSTKSLITSVCFPTWVWIHKPSTRFLFGSFSEPLATKHSVFRRNLIESSWYRNGYGSLYRLAADFNTKSEFANNYTGQMKSAGILGSITGEGGDYIIIDDPHDPKKAASEAERESAIENFDLAWSSRLNDKKTGRIIVIMQRLHERDLTGHLLAKDLGYTHLKIPTEAHERERIFFPMSGISFEREQGELLHPERDGPAEIAQAKKDLGPYGYSGQHDQDPTPRTGGLFKDTMFDFVDLPPLESFDYTFITADTSYKEKHENDFTVFSAWGVKSQELYLLDVWREQIRADKVEVPAAHFCRRFQMYNFRSAWIEPKGHGIYLNGKLPQDPYGIMIPSESDISEFFKDRKIDKVERANNAVPHLANRRIHIGNQVPEKEYLVTECLTFPKARHDDFVDTVVDAIKKAFANTPSMFDAF